MVREEEVGGSETHEMATFQPHKSTVFRPFNSTCNGSNIDPPKHNVNDATSDKLTRAEQDPSKAQAQTRVYFPTIVEGSMT